jgi:hypothetical protein
VTAPLTLEQQIVALAILEGRVKAVRETLRRQAAERLDAGAILPVNLPSDDSTKPLVVGVLQRPKDSTTAGVADRAAWTDWVAAEHCTEVVETPPGRSDVVLDDALVAALEGAYAHSKVDDPWTDPRESWRAFLDELNRSGWTLTPVVVTRGGREVRRSYEEAVLKASQKAGRPITPDGEEPPGIKVTSVPNAVRVTTTKDDALARRYINGLPDTQLAALTRGPETEEAP